MADNVVKESENRALIEHMTRTRHVEELEHLDLTAAASLYAVPLGMTLTSSKPFLDALRSAPERAEGTSRHLTLQSFIDHVQRFKDANSVLFMDIMEPTAPKIICIYDYNAPGAPRFGRHRASYTFPLSEEWKKWGAHFGRQSTQVQFAELLEERMMELLHPDAVGVKLKEALGIVGLSLATPQEMLALSRGLAVAVDQSVKQAIKLSNGAAKVVFEERSSTSDAESGAPVVVPGGFAIAIPVFENGQTFQVGVRLRYRTPGQKLVWEMLPLRLSNVFDVAMRETAELAKKETGCPLFFGRPEKSTTTED